MKITMNRRQFLCASALAAGTFAGVRDLSAATYDLVIKGGRVIDPSVGLDRRGQDRRGRC
jgi:dihydroorotase